jgi:hypothetical protein
MACCSDCFGDRGLRKSIIPLHSTQTGQCSYCSSENVPILAPTQLTDNFSLLIGAYEETEAGGKPILQLLREDWGLFRHRNMDDTRANQLLSEILDDKEIVRKKFSPSTGSEADRLGEWEKLRDELMYRNRFFPQTNIDLNRLELLLSQLTLGTGEIPTAWYRARIQNTEEPFGMAEMGAPSSRITSHGRANPAGIPYLYLASAALTAISEIRPHTGETACVADFEIPADLNLVDLRSPRTMVSPFLLGDAADIVRMRNDLPFLERLGDELTRPVIPQAAAIDYTPSQYLCEFIKKCGYAGVIYRSSVAEGMNLALFNPRLARIGPLNRYRITQVSVDAKPLAEAKELADLTGS